MSMHRLVVGTLIVCLAAPAWAASREERRLEDAREVLEAALEGPNAIPPRLLERAKGVAIFSGIVRGGFIWGGRAGSGVLLVRGEDGSWSPPAFISIAGGSWGLQVGLQSVDAVFLVMNDRGLRSLMKNRSTLGADAAVTAGPTSASGEAAVDAALKAEILAYTRARGAYAGISLQGSHVWQDSRANENLYGRRLTVERIVLRREVEMPEAARPLVEVLERGAE